MKKRNLLLGGLLVLLLLAILLPKVLPDNKGYPDALAVIDTSRVERVELVKGSDATTLEKRNGVWTVTRPVLRAADPAAVQRMLDALADLRVAAKVQDNAGNAEDARFELDDAKALRVSVKAAGETVLEARFGKASSDFSSGFARYESDPVVYRTAQNLGSRLSAQRSRWIDKTIFKTEADNLATVALERADGELAFENRDSLWTMDWKPAKGGRGWSGEAIKETELSALKNAVAHLRMSDLADSAQTAALAGVVEGTTLHLTLKDGAGRVFRFARLESETGKAFCQAEGDPTWFAVYKSTLDRFEKEPSAFRPE